jgi:hypothetical protein
MDVSCSSSCIRDGASRFLSGDGGNPWGSTTDGAGVSGPDSSLALQVGMVDGECPVRVIRRLTAARPEKWAYSRRSIRRRLTSMQWWWSLNPYYTPIADSC